MEITHDLILEVETPINIPSWMLVAMIQNFLASKGYRLQESTTGQMEDRTQLINNP